MNCTISSSIASRITRMFSIGILTADRLFAIKYSLRYMIIFSKRQLKIVLIVSWLGLVSFAMLKSLRADIYIHAIIVMK